MEEKEYGKYYECIKEEAKDKPKMSLAELREHLKGIHTLERYWERLENEKSAKSP